MIIKSNNKKKVTRCCGNTVPAKSTARDPQIRHLHSVGILSSAASTSTETTSNWPANRCAAQWWLKIHLTYHKFKTSQYNHCKTEKAFHKWHHTRAVSLTHVVQILNLLCLHDVSDTCQPLINSHGCVCGLVTAKTKQKPPLHSNWSSSFTVATQLFHSERASSGPLRQRCSSNS